MGLKLRRKNSSAQSNANLFPRRNQNPLPQYSIVVPAYNETKTLKPTINSISEYADSLALEFEIIVVDDGSCDGTGVLAGRLSKGDLRVRSIRTKHFGKGSAVRTGISYSTGETILISDADLPVAPDEIFMLAEVSRRNNSFCVGARILPGPIQGPRVRQIFAWAFKRYVGALLSWAPSDPNSCARALPGNWARLAVHEVPASGFSFDIELLHAAWKDGIQILERPVAWDDRRAHGNTTRLLLIGAYCCWRVLKIAINDLVLRQKE